MDVRKIKREQALKKVVSSRVVNDRTRFIVKYDPRLTRFSETLRSSWKILIEDPVMKKIYPSPPMVCYQRVEDLKDLLVKPKLPRRQRLTREKRDKVGFKPCNKSRYHIIPIEKIRSRDSMVRKVRESYYIQKFNSVRSGLNKKT